MGSRLNSAELTGSAEGARFVVTSLELDGAPLNHSNRNPLALPPTSDWERRATPTPFIGAGSMKLPVYQLHFSAPLPLPSNPACTSVTWAADLTLLNGKRRARYPHTENTEPFYNPSTPHLQLPRYPSSTPTTSFSQQNNGASKRRRLVFSWTLCVEALERYCLSMDGFPVPSLRYAQRVALKRVPVPLDASTTTVLLVLPHHVPRLLFLLLEGNPANQTFPSLAQALKHNFVFRDKTNNNYAPQHIPALGSIFRQPNESAGWSPSCASTAL